MASLVFHNIAAFDRAKALKLPVTYPEDVTDEILVQMAISGDMASALDIVVISNERLRDAQPSMEYELFNSLMHSTRFGCSLEDLAALQDFLNEYRQLLCEVFHGYLSECVNRAKTLVPLPEDCPDKSESAWRRDWLGQAFYLRPPKGPGRPIDPERDADVARGVKRIALDLSKRVDDYPSWLDRALANYDGGKLPKSIEGLINIQGYPLPAKYADNHRRKLAKKLRRSIDYARGSEKRRDKAEVQAAANAFMICKNFCLAQVIFWLKQDTLSSRQRDQLQELRISLHAYSFKSKNRSRKGRKRSQNATGMREKYKKYGKYFDDESRCIPIDRTDEIEDDLLRSTPVVGDAVGLIDRMETLEDCDRVFRDLQTLRDATPASLEGAWKPRLRIVDKKVEKREPVLIERYNSKQRTIKVKPD